MSVNVSCVMFVYGSKISDDEFATRYAGCRLVRQSGFWMHHLRAVPEVDVRAHDYTLLMIDGVEMNADVDLHVLARIMEANCLSLAGPACTSCKSKQLIRPVRDKPSYAVGRRVQYLDPQIQMYTSTAFLCLQRLIDLVGLQADPTGWSISTLSTSFCANRVGIVDAMSVEKIYSKSTYSWDEAERTAQAASDAAMQRVPGLKKANPAVVFGPLVEPRLGIHFDTDPAGLHHREDVSRGPHTSASMGRRPLGKARASMGSRPLGNAAEAAAEVERRIERRQDPPRWPSLPMVDVVCLNPGSVTPATDAEHAAIMAALRYRLRLHASFAAVTIVVESNVTHSGEPTALVARPGSTRHSLTAAEMTRYHVAAHLVFPAAIWRVRMSSYAMSSARRLKLEYPARAELLLWLERHYPDHVAFLSDVTELLDPRAFAAAGKTVVRRRGGDGSTQQHKETLVAADVTPPFGADPTTALRARQWLAASVGACAVPRMRGFRYGNPSCAELGSWASSAVFIRMDASWVSWRARRALQHASGGSPLGQPLPRISEAGIACPLVGGPPTSAAAAAAATTSIAAAAAAAAIIPSPSCREGRWICDDAPWFSSGASTNASAAAAPSPAASSAYMGWNLLHVLRPLREMLRALNDTLSRRPPLHGGRPALAAYEEHQAKVRAVFARGRAGVIERIQSCAEYVPPRVSLHDARAARAAASRPQLTAGRLGLAQPGEDATVPPPLAGWPRTQIE